MFGFFCGEDSWSLGCYGGKALRSLAREREEAEKLQEREVPFSVGGGAYLQEGEGAFCLVVFELRLSERYYERVREGKTRGK